MRSYLSSHTAFHCTVRGRASPCQSLIANHRTLCLQKRLSLTRPMFLRSILVSWGSSHRLYAGSHLRRGIIIPAELMKRQSISITPFRIRRTLVDESLERNSRVFILPGLKISPPDLAPRFALAVLGIASDDSIEVRNRISEPALLARDAAQLIVRVGFVGVNLNRAREARLRFLVLSALLIDQSEIVMRRRISRIEGRGFEVSLEVFTRSLRACDITQKVSQQDDDQDQQERRRE